MTETSLPKMKSLQGKFVRSLLVVSSLMAIATTFMVVLMSAQASAEHFASVQGHIQEGIVSKGKVLTQNHALALRSLVLDNAFLDMQRLVEHAVGDDEDVVYGVFVNGELTTLAKSRRGDALGKSELPEREAWRGLGLKESDVSIKAARVERARRLDRDLVEVAYPVVSEEGEALGMIRYGLSTARMHAALDRAKRDSDARLRRSMLLMGALVTLVAGLGLLLSRAQAMRITEPIGKLTQAAEALARGDRSMRVNIMSGDELSVLGASFNRMVDELQQMNRTLEQKVETRTAELALKNRDMRLVLDNVDQGLIMLSPRGVIAPERSAVVSEWFGETTAQPIWDYLARFSPRFADALRIGWSQIEDEFLPLEVCVGQLPKQMTHGARSFSFRYLPFETDGRLEGVLLVIADITDRLAHEHQEAEQRELMQAFRRLISDRNDFTGFMREASAMIDAITSTLAMKDELALKRVLHTFKGNAGMMGLGVVSQLCHSLETELAETGHMGQSTLDRLQARWSAISSQVTGFTTGRDHGVIEVPEAEYSGLIAELTASGRDSLVLETLLRWQQEPVQKPLSRLAEQARALARRLDKGEIDVDVEVVGQDVRLQPKQWAAFFAEMVHLVRNAVDHGLEFPGQRTALGKPPRGCIQLKASVEDGSLIFEVTDDGRGIAWAKIEERAANLGLPHGSSAELLRALCSEGVTTRETVSDVSGRGVGMASLWAKVTALEGCIDVRSNEGAGTSWFIRFPWPAKVLVAQSFSRVASG